MSRPRLIADLRAVAFGGATQVTLTLSTDDARQMSDDLGFADALGRSCEPDAAAKLTGAPFADAAQQVTLTLSADDAARLAGVLAFVDATRTPGQGAPYTSARVTGAVRSEDL